MYNGIGGKRITPATIKYVIGIRVKPLKQLAKR
jgi:hypothetical protein